jgi:hypothetical protein
VILAHTDTIILQEMTDKLKTDSDRLRIDQARFVEAENKFRDIVSRMRQEERKFIDARNKFQEEQVCVYVYICIYIYISM